MKKKIDFLRFNKKKSEEVLLLLRRSLIYFLSFLFGEVLKVKSHLKNIYSQDKIDDYAHIILDFKNKTCASIDASWSVSNYRTPYLKIFFEGNNGNLTLTEDRISFFLKSAKNSYMEGNNILQIPEIKSGVSFDVAGSHYAHQAKYFIDLWLIKRLI